MLVEPEPVLVDPEPVPVEPELLVPDDEPVEPEDPDDVAVCEDDVPLVCEPGSIRVTTPAVATLARLTATVVLLIRLRPRARSAIARRTCSRFGVFMTGSLPSASGELLCTSSQPPMSLDADVLPLGPVGLSPIERRMRSRNCVRGRRRGQSVYAHSRATDWPPPGDPRHGLSVPLRKPWLPTRQGSRLGRRGVAMGRRQDIDERLSPSVGGFPVSRVQLAPTLRR